MTEWIVSSSVLILVIILLRKILKGEISLRLQYALWALVLVRLLVPVNLVSSGMSVMNLEFFRSAVQIEAEAQDFALPDLGISEPNPDLPLEEQETQYEANRAEWERVRDEYKRAAGPVYITNQLLKLVWSGAAVVGTVFLASNLRFAIRLRRNRKRLKAENIILPVYMTDEVETPCLFGLFRPAIYVPPEVAENAAVLRYAIAHETTHFRHYDHLWAILRGVCLTVHWYNPLVWRAAFLSQQDGELACDEGTIHTLGENERTEYGRTLIAMTCEKRPALLRTSTTMTGSGRSLKERVTMLVKKPKTARCALIAVAVVAVVAVGCTFTTAEEPYGEGERNEGTEIEVEIGDETLHLALPKGLCLEYGETIDGKTYAYYFEPIVYEVLGDTSGTPVSWTASGGIELYNNCAIWDGDTITDIQPLWNHSSWEHYGPIEGTQIPSYLIYVWHDLYTAAGLGELEMQGVDLSEIKTTSEYWCVILARPEDETCNVISLDAENHTREDIVALAKSVTFD